MDVEDIYFFRNQCITNFITDKKIVSEFVNLNNFSKKINLDNKIVCIENADPGFDFIFSYKIMGLITAFGGPNSHMSIRCNEFAIPAAIGIGEKKFEELVAKHKVILDCNKKNNFSCMKKNLGLIPTIYERRDNLNIIIEKEFLIFLVKFSKL